ncbi:nucleotidyltransferase family protein [Microbacterium sp. 13-71-7]|jgi:hypothetical protein|uniref:nucleotidyltransferase family protein n=1 Tax=Microbacterium sp. 13-71-7 TaxID=1970399 RepID=UPI000BCDC5C3|nr:nucleotidyltransferase family protein [Microbacterium sp. 13-71-7]OZB80742.1 MAG: hypothetical protein B7X32_18690 [Microbacterium sp. 13-71-7]
MTDWAATAYGALDLRTHELADQGFELIVIPTRAGEPRFLFGAGAALWRRLVDGSVTSRVGQEPATQAMLLEMAEAGFASRSPSENSVVAHLSGPWMSSPLHELVYALVEHVARENSIDVVFIKGPLLYAQGLRVREHSGDVDCWTRPKDAGRLSSALEAWGWAPLHVPFEGTMVSHSITMQSDSWGCEIDIHTRFPGIAAAPVDAFEEVLAATDQRQYAGVEVNVPTVPLHAVIASLHLLRPLGGDVQETDIEEASRILRAGGPDTIGLTRSLNAGYVLARPLAMAFPEADTSMLDATVPEDWAWRSADSVFSGQWKALSLVPWRQRIRVAFRLLWPSRARLRSSYTDAGTTWREMTAFRILRLRSAIRGLFRRS